jgi:tetratricopeptide (TPR) repeat protein
MKKSVLYFLFFIFITLPGKAGDNDYIINMLNAKTMTDTATVQSTLVTAANYFERIALMNPEKWLPYYYAAYCYTRISHLNKGADKRDAWVDKAQIEIDKAFKNDPKNSEILVMKGFVLQARMDINPMVRGFEYNKETLAYFDKAIELNPDNPRSYLWKGVNLYHTPSFFGGGKDKAYILINTAIEKFKANPPKDMLAPDWGYKYALEMIEKCK